MPEKELELFLESFRAATFDGVGSQVTIPAGSEENFSVLVSFVPDYRLDCVQGVFALPLRLNSGRVRHFYNNTGSV